MGLNATIQFRLQQRLVEAQQRVFSRMVELIVEDTPVLTGSLKSSWVFSAGEPVLTRVKGATDPIPTALNAIRTLVKGGDAVYYFANGQPYASRIEYTGHSGKAPNGMVRINLLKLAEEGVSDVP
jgi:hypothetical protein